MRDSNEQLKEILGAVYRKDFSALETLAPADVNLRDRDGRSPLMHAVLAEDADSRIVRLLIERGADLDAFDRVQKWTALHFAARDQKEAVVRALLEAGAMVDPIDVFGNTPLWQSVMHASSSLATFKELVEHGANPRRKNNYGVTPIGLAHETGRADIVALFEARLDE